jgi:hypothetical protein
MLNSLEIFTMQRRQFIRLVGGGSVAAAAAVGTATLSGCSTGVPPEAIEAWQGPDASVRTDADVRRWLLSYAILAPHSHNLQSWIADLGVPNEITLRCDLNRLLPQTDPLSRQIMLSHGTFLELLDIAARERGLKASIDLFPEGVFGPDKPDARPVARIRLAPDASLQKDPLFAQILSRHTNRSTYDISRAVPDVAWSAIASSVDQTFIRTGYAGLSQPEALVAHRNIAREAWRIELTTPRTIMESFDVLRVGASEIAAHRDGLIVTAAMPVMLARLGLFDRSKPPAPDNYATTSQIETFDQALASTPGFMWMVTKANDRITQVNAGRAWARAHLAATAQGLAMQPLSQALQEYPEQTRPYRDIHALVGANSLGQTVQMWARVGFAPPVGPAPRRRLADIVSA